ncbi:MAG: flagellar basal-body rod protein FlgC [Actinomycetia bacterium]|nr:flagellar basal-body rod protein FlgC [Actinomycetes bacterium]MCP4224148.1 flagellar basal-body rod protein FlgC [Actinomycetes bacterium]MCP5035291.1 flagellar basal-body rod protein FlgC [Actinomycetes bacterium]
MSGPFHSLSISGSGMDVYQTWLEAIADNVANINNVSSTDEPAFQERIIVAQATEGGVRPEGVRVKSLEFGDPNGEIIYEPTHALADEDGFIRMPKVNLAQQMTHMLVAQRAYQANVSAFRTARDAYQRAMEIGR